MTASPDEGEDTQRSKLLSKMSRLGGQAILPPGSIPGAHSATEVSVWGLCLAASDILLWSLSSPLDSHQRSRPCPSSLACHSHR